MANGSSAPISWVQARGVDRSSLLTRDRSPRTASRLAAFAAALLCLAAVFAARFLSPDLTKVRFPAESTFTGADGREYVYLRNEDSWLFLRTARDRLERGTPCAPASPAGSCHDSLSNAPHGMPSAYAMSLHPRAIAAMHRIMSVLRHGIPLSASTGVLIQILTLAGCAIMFVLGLRIGGIAGGVAAALFTSLSPAFLWRTLGADNDAWHLVLPAGAALCLLVACEAKRGRLAVGLACLAGFIVAMHSAVWCGFVLAFGALCLALLARAALQRPAGRSLMVAGAFAAVVIPGSILLATPCDEAIGFLRAALGMELVTLNYPDIYATVAELSLRGFAAFARTVGSRGLVALCLLGAVTMLASTLRGFGVAAVAGAVIAAIIPFDQTWLPALIFGAAIALAAYGARKDGRELGPALLVAGWCLAGLLIAPHGSRFHMLALPGLALGLAGAAGGVAGMAPRRPWRVALACVLLLAVLAVPFSTSVRGAQLSNPNMNDALFETLEVIRDRAAPDAIVVTWWDFGYYTQFVSRRATPTDGGTLASRANHWVAAALVAPTEEEALGRLRMLGCGSDTRPLHGGERGAPAILESAGVEPAAAHALVSELVRRDRAAAENLLARQGLNPSVSAAVLEATHCDPPEVWVLTSTAMSRLASSWVPIATWDPQRLVAFEVADQMPPDEAREELMRRFDMEASTAADLDNAARAVRDPAARQRVVSPSGSYAGARWYPCERGEGELRCAVGFGPGGGELVIGSMELQSILVRQGAVERPFLPSYIALLRDGNLERRDIAQPTDPLLALIVDEDSGRACILPATLGTALFTRLELLDGRAAPHFRREHTAATSRERVTAWRVEFPGQHVGETKSVIGQ